jgi:hypothetical protein
MTSRRDELHKALLDMAWLFSDPRHVGAVDGSTMMLATAIDDLEQEVKRLRRMVEDVEPDAGRAARCRELAIFDMTEEQFQRYRTETVARVKAKREASA